MSAVPGPSQKSFITTIRQRAVLTTKRRTLRWPLVLFYNMLDIACLATYIIYKENNPKAGACSSSRREFLQELGKNLCMNAIRHRATNLQVTKQFTTKLAIESLLGYPISCKMESYSTTMDKKTLRKVIGCCHFCKSTVKRQRKTRKCCNDCHKPVCDEHSMTIFKCNSCL